jgi:hypothetical protein
MFWLVVKVGGSVVLVLALVALLIGLYVIATMDWSH